MAFGRKKHNLPAKAAPRGKRLLTPDRLLTLLGFVVAGSAAFLPWYAVIGGDALGIHNDGMLRLSGHRPDLAISGPNGSIRPFGRKQAVAEAKPGVDDLSTGTILEISRPIEQAKRAHSRDDQPFPGRPFHVVHVANGQALIADGNGMYLVGVGSKLPDNTTLKGFRRADGHWLILTSDGDLVGPYSNAH